MMISNWALQEAFRVKIINPTEIVRINTDRIPENPKVEAIPEDPVEKISFIKEEPMKTVSIVYKKTGEIINLNNYRDNKDESNSM